MEKRVLIVDDSVFIYEEIKYMLDGTNYRIVGYAKDGEQAVRMYGELLPDVVLMDIIMPGINGIDTSKLILDKWSDAKIVIASSLAYDEALEKAEETGISGFLYKLLERDKLLDALDEATADIGQ